MKHLFYFLFAALLFAGCEKEPVAKEFKIDPMATINIKPAVNGWQKSPAMRVSSDNQPEHLSALEIVRQTRLMSFIMSDGRDAARGFAPHQRDTISDTPMLKMYGTDIMSYFQLFDGTYTDSLLLHPAFLEAKNCVLVSYGNDTIGYVPNAALRNAETLIKALWEAKDYEPIYVVFHDAYTFLPITGAEYRALDEQ